MRVQRVVMSESGRESWTLLGDDLAPVEPVERFLAFLASVEKSPNTVKAYAHDLKRLVGLPLPARAGLAVRDVGGCGGVRRLAAAAAGGPRRPGCCVANGGASLLGSQCEPEAGGVDLVLRVPCPPR